MGQAETPPSTGEQPEDHAFEVTRMRPQPNVVAEFFSSTGKRPEDLFGGTWELEPRETSAAATTKVRVWKNTRVEIVEYKD